MKFLILILTMALMNLRSYAVPQLLDKLLQDALNHFHANRYEQAMQAWSEAFKLEHFLYYGLLHTWKGFVEQVKKSDLEQAEKLLVLKTIFPCFKHPLESKDVTQFLSLIEQLKSTSGLRLFHLLLTADVPKKDRSLSYYIEACQFLIELKDSPGLLKCVKSILPDLGLLVHTLRDRHNTMLSVKYPERNLDETISAFAKKDANVAFPLSMNELSLIKKDYEQVKKILGELQTESQETLKEKLKDSNKFERLAILIETLRRTHRIQAYDTQILSILALLNAPEKMKGRIAQIKTGEGKSSIIALLAAFMACQGQSVDVITSSSYLARRDCEKYTSFYNAAGLSSSYIDYAHIKQSDFNAQIIYGTNTDFEFSYLEDNLYQHSLRCSQKEGKLQPRSFDVVIVDEADNLFLDAALNSARMAIPRQEEISWIYPIILDFVKTLNRCEAVTNVMIENLQNYLIKHADKQYETQIHSFSRRRLANWLESAQEAWYRKKEKYHYLVKEKENSEISGEKEIVIIDFANTGRLNQGSQWQHGLHQFLQAKHQLKIKTESFTAASLCHPTYFNLYQKIFGLTGTLGEPIERKEIEAIYQVDSFDVPPHFPSLRKTPAYSIVSETEHFDAILKDIEEKTKRKQPVLVLFKTIADSEKFSDYLTKKGMKHQLLNENQQESENYIVGRAGEAGQITIATNTAGRGTDILLSPESIQAGGLHMIFTFYPDNLRVEGQGFGRAYRQGQPGSLSMILNIKDDFINRYSSRLTQIIKNLPAEEAIEVLDRLRSMQIEKQSKWRSLSSQIEMLYYEKLSHFFEKIKETNAWFSQPENKQSFITACEFSDFSLENELPFSLESKEWKLLEDIASSLLEKQEQGIKVNWEGFYAKFTESYLAEIQLQWAKFYSKLQDEVDRTDPGAAKEKIDKLSLKAEGQITQLLNHPEQNIQSYLQKMHCQMEKVSELVPS
ncbi:hypothetical protein [Legionella genomosp. 1]|uniref:preprotein translocase subunit SecA n=1 Tax=Legionella genomosp. 1 TaxID=1093625 RepID=UPI001056DC3B|nr:hypothetical protein [Legionella genomosp. 1]